MGRYCQEIDEEKLREADEAEAARLLAEAKKRAARLARRTPEEIAYDEACEKRQNALDDAEEAYRVCKKDAKDDFDLCMMRATALLAVGLAGCLLSTVAYAKCAAVVIAVYLAGTAFCAAGYDEALDDCDEDYERAKQKIERDHPVPPKPDSHDYRTRGC